MTHVACAFDHVIESFRNELFAGYKTGEGVDPDLLAQFRPGRAGDGRPRCRRVADGRVRGGRRARVRRRPPSGRPRRRAGGDLLPRQGPLAVRRRQPGHLPGSPPGPRPRRGGRHREVRRPAPRRSPTGSPSWATAPTGSPASRAGARSRRARSWPGTGRIEAIPDDAARWDVDGPRAATAWPASLRERREEAALYRRLATLRTDVPLAEGLADLEWRGAAAAISRRSAGRSGPRTFSAGAAVGPGLIHPCRSRATLPPILLCRSAPCHSAGRPQFPLDRRAGGGELSGYQRAAPAVGMTAEERARALADRTACGERRGGYRWKSAARHPPCEGTFGSLR